MPCCTRQLTWCLGDQPSSRGRWLWKVLERQRENRGRWLSGYGLSAVAVAAGQNRASWQESDSPRLAARRDDSAGCPLWSSVASRLHRYELSAAQGPSDGASKRSPIYARKNYKCVGNFSIPGLYEVFVFIYRTMLEQILMKIFQTTQIFSLKKYEFSRFKTSCNTDFP